MTRYIMKDHSRWAVVESTAKRKKRLFRTQKEAIAYASIQIDTDSIIVTSANGKVKKLNSWQARKLSRELVLLKEMLKK